MANYSLRMIGIVAGVAVLATVLLLGGARFLGSSNGPAAPLPAPGVAAPVDGDALMDASYNVTIAVLQEIYAAFAETSETAIYDGLAGVAVGDALSALYLERAGALARGGLPDQVVHELQLLGGTWDFENGALRADIRWAVLGEVGHAEHTHMRGNAYSAVLLISATETAWRLSEFELTDVDRSDNGTLTTIEPLGTVTQ